MSKFGVLGRNQLFEFPSFDVALEKYEAFVREDFLDCDVYVLEFPSVQCLPVLHRVSFLNGLKRFVVLREWNDVGRFILNSYGHVDDALQVANGAGGHVYWVDDEALAHRLSM